MDIYELKEMNWVNPKDWSTLTASSKDSEGNPMVNNTDVDLFVKKTLEEISEQSKISISIIEDVFEEQNSDFLKYKRHLFKCCVCVSKDFWRLKELKQLLKVPDMSAISN